MDRVGKVGREADNMCALLIVLEKAQIVQWNQLTLLLRGVAAGSTLRSR